MGDMRESFLVIIIQSNLKYILTNISTNCPRTTCNNSLKIKMNVQHINLSFRR
jgi:hypothetical protein